MQQSRLDFLDIAKGITVLWVVWMHMEMPMYLWASFQMPFFFILSGTLYKQPDINKGIVWIKRKAISLLVPAFTFFCISALLMESKSEIGDLSWFWRFHKYSQGGIIWFLQAMFLYLCFHYLIVRYLQCKYWGILISLIFYPIGYFLYGKLYYDIIPCIPVAHILVNWIYFELGCLWGRNYQIITDPKLENKRLLFACFAVLFVVLVCTPVFNELCFRRIFGGQNLLIPVYGMVYNICMTYLVVLFSYKVGSFFIARPWRFYGHNSLVVYLAHWPIYIYAIKPLIDDGMNKFLGYVIVVALITTCIYFFNFCCPILIGKCK
ncbi:acyltransferase family protein [Bacteroides congonensis]|uniref:acyltransferase family protein n=1 Tax=Bacteroides congonensis TaxID=1871006 RepID=UPI003A88C550